MRLQLALDLMTLEEAKTFLENVVDFVDIIEIGTPMIIRDGIKAVTEIKEIYPQATVLADLKIIDAGQHEAHIGFQAGADIITVLGMADDATIQGALTMARRFDGEVMVDLIAVSNVRQRAIELDEMGCDYVCVHTGTDVQARGQNPLAELAEVHDVLSQAKLAVAGGITPDSLPRIAVYQPAVVVVGGYITNSPNNRVAMMKIRKRLG